MENPIYTSFPCQRTKPMVIDQHFMVVRHNRKNEDPLSDDEDFLRAYDLNTPEGLFWKPIECYWNDMKGVNNILGKFNEPEESC